VPDHQERVHKVVAASGIMSRRAAEQALIEGRITVNDKTVTEPGTLVDPRRDRIEVDGMPVDRQQETVVILLNKPRGFLVSRADDRGRRIVFSLLPQDLPLKAVGRLDFNTEGAILFTNDGALANFLTHPSNGVLRVYEARVRNVPGPEAIRRLREGVMLDDGLARAEDVQVTSQTDKNSWVRLVLLEGRNREVRRLLEAVGHPVVRLKRLSFAGLGVDDAPPGAWRFLSQEEVADLRQRGHVGAIGLDLFQGAKKPPRRGRTRPQPGQNQPRARERDDRPGDRDERPRDGFDREGFDREGFDRRGFNR